MRAHLAGVGTSVGEHVVPNQRFARIMETDDDWIRERTGIEQRRFVNPGEGSSTLGVRAARAAIADADISASEIDYIVCATMTPDHYFPGSGTLIQDGLGIDPVPALDLRQQCAGFAYGLQVTDSLIRSGVASCVLLVGADVHTSLMPFKPRTWEVLLSDQEERLEAGEEFDWNTRFRNLVVLFGDAAGAMVFKAGEDDERGILGATLQGDGGKVSPLHVPGLGSKRRPMVDETTHLTGDWVPVMDGRQVFKLAVTRMPASTKEVAQQCGLTMEDIDLVVMHQANLRINEAAQKLMKLPDEKVFNNIQRYGNTTSATLPLCFSEARQERNLSPGSVIVFTALGAGLHWGAVLLRL